MFIDLWNFWFSRIESIVDWATSVISYFTMPVTELFDPYIQNGLGQVFLDLLDAFGLNPTLFDMMVGSSISFFIVYTLAKWVADIIT